MSRIKQSFSLDGFARSGTEPEKLLREAANIGYEATELVTEDLFPLVKAHGLKILAIAGFPLTPEGVTRRENRDHLEKEIRAKLRSARRRRSTWRNWRPTGRRSGR